MAQRLHSSWGRDLSSHLFAANAAAPSPPAPALDLLLSPPLQIKECDGILVAMEGMLGRFQSDLGNVSGEIRSLQEQSSSMGVRLRNRRSVQERLEAFIDHVSIPPQLIFGVVQVGALDLAPGLWR